MVGIWHIYINKIVELMRGGVEWSCHNLMGGRKFLKKLKLRIEKKNVHICLDTTLKLIYFASNIFQIDLLL